MVLEKTLESPLDCKEIQTFHPKGNQSWIFTSRTEVEAETPILWPPDVKKWLIGKDPDAGKDWRWRRRGWQRMASPTQWTWVWQTPGDGDGQGGLACCSLWGHKESDMTERLSWTDIWQTHSKHYPQWQNIENISSQTRDKTRVPTLTTTIQHSLEVLAIAIREELKGIQIGKEKYKTLTVCRLYQIRSVAQSCPTLCDPMNHSTPVLPVQQQLPEFTQTHVHRVSDASSHLILCRPLLLLPPIPPSITLFQWVNSSHEVAKVLEFQL